MTCPTVIFAPNARQAQALAECLGCPALISSNVAETLTKFHNSETLLIVADIQSMATGWNAPPNTAVAFLNGCPIDDPLRWQAEARVQRHPRYNGRVIK